MWGHSFLFNKHRCMQIEHLGTEQWLCDFNSRLKPLQSYYVFSDLRHKFDEVPFPLKPFHGFSLLRIKVQLSCAASPYSSSSALAFSCDWLCSLAGPCLQNSSSFLLFVWITSLYSSVSTLLINVLYIRSKLGSPPVDLSYFRCHNRHDNCLFVCLYYPLFSTCHVSIVFLVLILSLEFSILPGI